MRPGARGLGFKEQRGLGRQPRQRARAVATLRAGIEGRPAEENTTHLLLVDHCMRLVLSLIDCHHMRTCTQL
jgi:hypothetical protein